MQWFKQIPGVTSLASARDFLDFFAVAYQSELLAGRELHILKDFHIALSQMSEPAAGAPAYQLAAQLLGQAYQRQTQPALGEHSPLAVYQRLRPSRVVLSSLWESDNEQ
ncbi:nitrogenase-stabilizing/protective protein NifW [Celerinatantimonas yamalensis]|uniref:Nitrogenase-stabilizing/protective protein NifW n=1 Tax=Celerinatantimonas yamalensis TaxID=559956 RepID=A0ABW9G4W3_9GAMM